jgi:hypothetical protein
MCRWTSGYTSKQTTTPSDDGAAARLTVRLRAAVGGADVVPVWTSECEKGDEPKERCCGGVPCFSGGACWTEMWKQLDLVADSNPTLGLLLLAKSFERSGADDTAGASWIAPAIGALGAADERRAGPAIAAGRLVAVLEAAGRKPDVVEREVAAAQSAGVKSVVVAFAPIDQSYAPKVVPLPK